MKEEMFTLKLHKDRKEYLAWLQQEKIDLEHHKRMMEIISEASKRGMKN